MARPRTHESWDLPANLYWDKNLKVYRYRRPDTKKFKYLSKNKVDAIIAARKLNQILEIRQDHTSRIMSDGKTLRDYIDERFLAIHLPEREIVESTRVGYMRQIKLIKDRFGNYYVYGCNVKLISDFLNDIKSAREANKYRGLLNIIFDYAVAEGFIATNPSRATLKHKEKVQRERLKLSEYNAIYQLAGKNGFDWLQDAMELGLITLQRRNEIVSAKFDDIDMEFFNDRARQILSVVQKKTKKHGEAAFLKIICSQTLEKLIEKRKATGISSPYIILPYDDVAVSQ